MNKPKLTLTSAIAFGLLLVLSISNAVESIFLWLGSRTTNNLIHCIGWLLLAALAVSVFLLEKPKMNTFIDLLKPLFLMVLCVWLCYFPSMVSLFVCGSFGLIYLLLNHFRYKKQPRR